MDRRTFVKSAGGAALLAASGGLATPALSQGAAAKTLRLVPQANLANFDPIWGTQYVVRNAAALVWDTLYGVDDKLVPQRQMVENESVSADGLVWTFKLRSGLKFHDGPPVLAKDAVQSLKRWAARDPMGLMIVAIQNELVAVDDASIDKFNRERTRLGQFAEIYQRVNDKIDHHESHYIEDDKPNVSPIALRDHFLSRHHEVGEIAENAAKANIEVAKALLVRGSFIEQRAIPCHPAEDAAHLRRNVTKMRGNAAASLEIGQPCGWISRAFPKGMLCRMGHSFPSLLDALVKNPLS